nr:hypothetical protein [Tanacetum cinerariifolium]
MRPFGCLVTILNTLDPLGKFDGKADEGFLVGYSNTNAAAFEVKEHESQVYVSSRSSDDTKKHNEKTNKEAKGKSPMELSIRVRDLSDDFEEFSDNSTNGVNVASTQVTTVGLNSTNSTNTFSAAGPSNTAVNMPALEDITYSDDEADVGAEADFSNLETNITISPIPTTRVHKDYPVTQIIEFHTYMFACFLSQEEPKRVLVDLPKGKRAIGSKWVFRNKKDERGIVIRNKAQLVAQGHTQDEGIDYEEVFAPVVRIEAIRLFLAYASFMGFMVYQMDDKSTFLYGTIKEEVYVCQPLGFEDPNYPDKVYKVVKALYGLHQAPRAWYEILAIYLLENGFQREILIRPCSSRSKMVIFCWFKSMLMTSFLDLSIKTLKQKQDGIFISQDKYVAEILRKFGLTDGKSASTPIDTEKPLLKDLDGEDVDVHTYRSMIGSLMYLTLSRPYIMFVVCACVRFQVTPKALHFHAVKRIFRYLKGKPHLGLWYPKDSPFNLVAYSDSDYAGASFDRKSTTRGCQFLGCRLISWQCKKQTVVATSSTQAEYVAATSCCAQVLWIQISCWIMGVNIPRCDEDSLGIIGIDGFLCTKLMRKIELKVRKGFSGVDTPLFNGMLMPQQAQDVEDSTEDEDDVNEVSAEPTPPSPTPAAPPPPPQPEHIPSSPLAETAQSSPPLQQQPSHNAKISMTLPNQLLETCATLTKQVANLEEDKVAQAIEITKLKQRVKRLEKKRHFKSSRLKRLKKVGTSQRVESSVDIEVNAEVTKDADVQRMLEESQAKVYHLDLEHAVKFLKVVTTATTPITAALVPKASALRRTMRYQALKRKPVTEAHARKNMMVYLKNISGFKMDFFRGMTYTKIRPIFERHYNLNHSFLERVEEEVTGQEEEVSKRKSKSSEQRAAKKQRIDEEVEELKTHLQIVPNDEDDVYTEATPLALKVPAVDYQIHHEHNKPFYKIIRADGTHQLFLSFITLLRNFDREDLEMLWKLVQERFQSSEPKNFLDDFLLNTLKTMFEKPSVEASIWRDQRGRYGFTLEQTLNNVRLEVKEESEVSLELLRLMRRQQQEGYKPE